MITQDPTLLAAAAALRTEVFVRGQGVAPEVEADGADRYAVHAVALVGGQVVATGRLLEEAGVARLGRIAVRADLRGTGLGAAVVADLTAAAASAGLPRLRLHAQVGVVEFYARLGWSVQGPPDVEAGIEHHWMTRDLLPGVRPVRDADAAALQALVAGCFAEYPGCVLELNALDAWMRAPAAGYAAKRGQLWVVPAGDGLAASVGWAPGSGPEAVELKTLYVAATARRRGLAAALVGLVERAARERAARRVELWTDTRFHDAHRLYERLGYARLPGERPLHDVSQTIEYPYAKIL
jgi:predicted GNAT family N-acyltransferase/RimJ/RimL family protein N-acetyltransferase